MPYDGPDDVGLPSNVKKAPKNLRKQWTAIFNSAIANCPNENDSGECESRAFRMANGVMKKRMQNKEFDQEEQAAWDEAVKCYGESMPAWRPYGGATSFAEIETWDESMKYQSQIGNITDQFRAITENIMGSDEIEAIEKADALEQAAKDLRTRLGQVSVETKEGEPCNCNSCQPDEPGLVDKVKSFLTGYKAEWTAKYINDLPDSSFAYVESGGDKDEEGKTALRSKRHFPHHDASGKMDTAHLANARARAAQSKSEFGKQAAAHLEHHAKTEGMGEHAKKEDTQNSSFVITKERSGDYRWFSVVTNRYYDRSKEVIPESAHKEFEEYLDTHKEELPQLWLWHTKGSRIGKCDFWTYSSDGFVLASGQFDKGKEHVAEALSARKDLGVSHGFLYPKGSIRDDGSYTLYRTFEVSVLPASNADNQLTAFWPIQLKEVSMPLRPDKRKFIEDAAGKDFADQLEKSLGLLVKEAEDKGISLKEFSELLTETSAALPDTSPEPIFATIEEKQYKSVDGGKTWGKVEEKVSEDIAGILAGIKAGLESVAQKVTDQGTVLGTLTGQVKELQKSDDEKVADVLAGRKSRTDSKPASDSPDNIVDPKEIEQKIKALGDLGDRDDPIIPYADDFIKKIGLGIGQ